jgi:hypothetical protein
MEDRRLVSRARNAAQMMNLTLSDWIAKKCCKQRAIGYSATRLVVQRVIESTLQSTSRPIVV